MRVIPMFLADFYKTSHKPQYPNKTEFIFANWIPRKSRIDGINKVVSFGIQRFAIEFLIESFHRDFFDVDINELVAEYERFMGATLGPQFTDTQHIVDLHELGYLPLEVKAIAEGVKVPIGVPMITIINTNPRFFWVTNYIETLISCEVWMAMTSATIADKYREILDGWAIHTTGSNAGVEFQGHDFSMRGMAGLDAAVASGMGHLTAFVGTDTIPAIIGMENYYLTDVTKELVGCSVPATEHSVECANCEGTLEGEYKHTKRLITELYPAGIVSKVSDTFDLWAVITEVLPRLKEEIMGRDGKLVIRPDSGDPVDILCGNPNSEVGSHAYKGVVELLWDIFGGTVIEETGFKLLDSHIGAIYGDSITLDRAEAICNRLAQKGFASVNVVLGIGSYTYQYNTRDTFGFAMKSTYAVVDGVEKLIFKDPITDDGTKKSLRGLCVVLKDADGELYVKDNLNREEYNNFQEEDQLLLLFYNGNMVRLTTLSDIRERLGR